MGNALPGASMRVTQWRRLMAVGALAPLFILSAVLGVVSPSAADDAVAETSGTLAVSNGRASTDNTLNESPNETVGEGDGSSPPAGESTVDAEQTEAVENDSNSDLSDTEATESLNSGTPTEDAGVDDQNDLLPEERSADTEEQYEARGVRSGSDFVQCGPGVVYSLQENGKIAKYDGSKTGSVAEMDIDGISSWGSAGWTGEYKYKELNGLAVTPTGDMYANVIKRVKQQEFMPPVDTVAIFYYNKGSWTTYSFPNLFSFDSQSSSVKDNELIFGAFNKDDQRYYFGGYKKINSVWNIQIYAFNAASASSAPTLVGTLPVAEPKNTNGDMAFDSTGNLYLVTGPIDAPKYTIYTIKKNDLNEPNPNGSLNYTSTATMDLPPSFSSGFGGMAFDSSGVMYLGSADTIVKANPTTGELLGDGTNTYGDADSSSDLASCGFPPTITLLKDLPDGRIRTSDQFDLTLYQPTDGTQVYGQTATQGDKSGIQANQVGPLPIYVPGTYRFGEQMADGSGSVLDAYSKTFKCVQEGKEAPIAEGLLGQDGKTSVYVSYDPNNPANVVCIITNRKTPPKVDLTLTKKGLPGESLLDGASFQLWLDDGNGTFDNGDPDQKINDAVFTSNGGRIVWENLTPGKYWVEELAAPNGYYIFDDNPVLVDLSEGKNLSIEVNNKKLGSVAWRKVDGGNKLLAGSKWKLVGPDPDTTEVAVTDCVTGEPPCPAGSLDRDPAAGEFKVEGLEWGSYTLVETNAPAGYQLDSSEHSFTIGAETVDYVFEKGFVNEQTTYDASLIKKDVDSEQVLSGAVFQLYEDTNNTGKFDTGDQLIAGSSKTSGADGKITWTDLSAGTYFAEETAAPAGYQLLSGPVVIVVPQETVVEVPNEKSSVPDLPLTGGLGSDLFIGLGGLFIGTGVLAYGALWWKRRSI